VNVYHLFVLQDVGGMPMDALSSRGGLQRGLQASTQRWHVTVVTTAIEFQQAVAAGEAHIEIRAHLDLSDLELLGPFILGDIPPTVQSIQVCPPFSIIS
jgi:hypothetical protein